VRIVVLVGSVPARASDPLFPSPALLPLSDPGGMQCTIDHTPGPVRPFVTTLGVARPLDGKKHDTTSSRWTEGTDRETSKDGVVVTDTVPDTKTDT
jgi:hypothetical protein